LDQERNVGPFRADILSKNTADNTLVLVENQLEKTYVFTKAFEGLVIDRMECNEEIFSRLMSDEEFRKMASEHLLNKVYRTKKTRRQKFNLDKSIN